MSVLDGATVLPFGETAVVLEYGDRIDPELHQHVLAVDRAITEAALPGVEEVVPSYRSLLVRLEPLTTTPEELVDALRGVSADDGPEDGEVVTVAVDFGGADGPDLEEVAARTGVGADEAVRLLTSVPLRVYLHGFAPGFAYLGGVPRALHLPRRSTPRPPVPAGSVLLAAGQAALCPTPMPTGWWVVGRTDHELFDPDQRPPVPFGPGDHVQMVERGS